MPMDWENRSRNRPYRSGERPRFDDRDRDWSDRAGDEVSSWFGDDEAEMRRRVLDDRRYADDEDRRHRGFGGDYAQTYRGEYSRGRRSSAVRYGEDGPSRDFRRDELHPYDVRRGYADDERGLGGPSEFHMDRYGLAGWGATGSGYGMRERRRRYERSNERPDDRPFLEKASDEISSWFGDDEAERRREMDARHRGRGPKNYSRSDDRIREDVNDRLSDDAHIDASDIEVAVSAGEVTLSGTVSERFAKRHAEDIAESVSGVKHVQNNLRVGAATSSDSIAGGGAVATGLTGATDRRS